MVFILRKVFEIPAGRIFSRFCFEFPHDYFPSLPSLIRGEANRQEKSQEVKEPAALNSAPSTRTYGMPKEEAEEPPVRSGPIYHMKEGFKSMISSLTGSGGSSTREKEEKPRFGLFFNLYG